MTSQSIRQTQWIVAPNAELARHRAMVDGRVTTHRLFVFDDRDQAHDAAGLCGERVFEFTYSFVPVERPADAAPRTMADVQRFQLQKLGKAMSRDPEPSADN